jgi:fructose-specific phosphotransferase system IIC component
MNKLNKLAHGIILAFFGVACWFVWVVLSLPSTVRLHGVELHLPLFTRVCIGLGTRIVVGLAIVATVYCLRVWIRKSDGRSSWVAFLATVTGALLLVTLPTIVAIYLPLVNALQHLAAQ